MSHYTEIQTEFRDRESLIRALNDLAYTADQIEQHEQPQALFGYHGDERPETANIIIRRKHIGSASNDVGFVKDKKTGQYRAIISDYDGQQTWTQEKQNRLANRYAYHQATKALRAKKYKWTEATNKAGQIVITVNME